jgi:dihydrodiol dehydrogenase / D-xylose 1-dehydrogenase (NADP)
VRADAFRWGIVTPGRIAHRFAQALEAVEGARLHAVASRSGDRARAFADQYGAPAAYDSVEGLAVDGDVDVVYVASPHRFHAEQARLCLEAGKPVLLEKPFTVNAAETAGLIDLAGSRKIFLMEALWSRYLPIYQQVREWLDGGAIGDIRFLDSLFAFAPEKDPEDRKFNHELAGGALLDTGVYSVSISEWVTGRSPSSIAASGWIGDTHVDELTAATLSYPNGAVSQFACSFLFDGVNDFTIYGSRGAIRIHHRFWESTEATLTVGGRDETKTMPFRLNGFEYQIEEVQRCLGDGKTESDRMPLASTLSVMQTMDEIRGQIGLKYAFE